MKNCFFIWILMFCGFLFPLRGQQKKIDSLLRVLPQTKDTNRCIVLRKLSSIYAKTDGEKGVEWAKKELEYARSIGSEKFMNDAYYRIGMYLKNSSSRDEALKYMDSSAALTLKDHDEKGMAMVYNAYGTIYDEMGKYPEAIENFIKAIRIKEKYNVRANLGNSYANLATVYTSLGLADKSQQYLEKAMSIMMEEKNYFGIAATANSLAVIRNNSGDYKGAVKVLERALSISDSVESTELSAALMGNIGESYIGLKQYKKAEEVLLISMKLREESADSASVAYCATCLATVYIETKQYDKALEYANKCVTYSLEQNYFEGLYFGHKNLADINFIQGNFKEAYLALQMAMSDADSMKVMESQKIISETEGKYQFEKKEAEIKLQNEKIKSNNAEIKKKNQQQVFFWIGISLFALLAVFIFRSYYIKKKSNEIILKHSREVEEQKHIIEEKQKEILDSIRYARRIQTALITNARYIEKSLKKLNKKGA